MSFLAIGTVMVSSIVLKVIHEIHRLVDAKFARGFCRNIRSVAHHNRTLFFFVMPMNGELRFPTFPIVIPTIRAVDSLITYWVSFKIEMNKPPKLPFFNYILIFLRNWIGKVFLLFDVIGALFQSQINIIRFSLLSVFYLYCEY